MATMDQPLCLIGNAGGENLVVNMEAVKILSAINQPVVVVTIVGKYRTGKSYLMNKLAGQKNGFALGSTIQSKTKGIWMWCIPHPKKTGHTLVLMDTEGLGDMEKGDSKNDAWIFCLAVLLSSTLVFNSVGTIDQEAMEQLHYVTELTEHIKMKSTPVEGNGEAGESGEFKRFFPSFIWCIRDFILNLEFNGETIDEDQYLEKSLKLRNGTGRKINEYNLPRECITHFFQSRKCFVFDRPASKKGLQNLENLSESELESAFVDQTANFLSYVYENSETKTLPGGLAVTGRMLGNLAVTYVNAILSGSIPCMENAVQVLAKIENSRAVDEAIATYDSRMSEHISKFPTETQEEFLQLHKESEKEALKVFMTQSFKDNNHEYNLKLIDDLAEKRKMYSQRNEETSEMKCRALIQELSLSLMRGITEGNYCKLGGHKLFVQEKQMFIDAYHQRHGKGIKALEELQKFLSANNVEAAILQADQTLTEKEKEIAVQSAQAEAAERERKLIEEHHRNLEERKESEKKSFQQHEEMLKKKMEEEIRSLIKENERLIAQKLKEQEDMAKNGLDKQCKMLQEQIDKLNRENAEANTSIWNRIFLQFLPKPIVDFITVT